MKLLILSDFNAATGFATVMHNILPYMLKLNDGKVMINILAINYYGEPYQMANNVRVMSAMKAMPHDKSPELRDPFGKLTFIQELTDAASGKPDEHPYDGVFIIQDPTHINALAPSLELLKMELKQRKIKQFKSIVYFPIDHSMPADPMIKEMGFYDEIVTYTEYARKQVLTMRPQWKGKIKVIPHGINPGHFFPLSKDEIEDFRKDYFGEANAQKFIIGNINRNQPRKDIPCTISAFKEYKKKNPDAFLYLHMNPTDPLGWDLPTVLYYAGLEENIDYMFPPKEVREQGITVEGLNHVYNACDVYVTTTVAEGWGLTVTEAMACRVPVICPLHTSLQEISDHGKRVYALENLYPVCLHTDSTFREQCDYLEVAERMEEVRSEKSELSTINSQLKTDLAYKYTQTLDWQIIGKQWYELMKKTY